MTEEYKSIKIEAYNYNLPDEQIAKYPLPNRADSKLLLYDSGNISHTNFRELGNYMPANSLMVFNNTKVIQARIELHKTTGARIEVFCLEPVTPSDFALSFASVGECVWRCIVGNSKKWKEGVLSSDIRVGDAAIKLHCERVDEDSSAGLIRFSWKSDSITFSQVLENIGSTPIPPYLNRKAVEADKNTYQTVYSKHKGSVAAPTAGLHFTPEVLQDLEQKNISLSELTLHVGAGTFRPVKSEAIGDHEMHNEHFFVTEQLINDVLNNKEVVTAVGTTTVRTLESMYWLGVKALNNELHPDKENILTQWEAYQMQQDIALSKALNALLLYMKEQKSDVLSAVTQIIIVPGYRFRIVKQLITNFHQPKSTLLLLIAAFVGNNWTKIYDYARSNNFRFLSYGDSSFLKIDQNQ